MSTLGSEREGADDAPLDRVEILLVDDDESWARATGRLLAANREPFHVETAHSLERGRAAFAELDPDCVVCDYQLGDGTGLDLLATVREADPDRPFVLVTGRGSESVASDAIGRGVTDYIRKDHDDGEADLLASRIENAVGNYRTERALERQRRSKNAMLEILTATTAEGELRRQFCVQLVEDRGYALAWIGSDGDATLADPDVIVGEQSYVEAVHAGDDDGREGEPARLALARDEAIAVEIDGDDATGSTDVADGWRAIARERGFAGAIAAPVRHDGVRFGVLSVYATEATMVGEHERRAIAEYAETIGYALRAAERKRSLLADTAVEIAVEIADPTVPAVALADRLPAGADLEIVSAVSRDGGATTYVVDVDASPDDVASAVADVDGLAVLASHERDGRRRCEILADAPTPEAITAGQGARFERTVAERGHATVTLSVPDDGTIETVVDALERRYDEAAVSTVWTQRSDRARGPDDDPLAPLTDRQREVLQHAFHVGYFSQPRDTSATELAAQLDVARATATQHLRTAQRKVFGEIVAEERDEPG